MRIITADWIFPPGKPPIRDGALLFKGTMLIEAGTREAITAAVPDAQVHTYDKSVLIPGLVNCHTHLELAALERIPADQGFVPWVRTLLAEKDKLTHEQILMGAEMALTTASLSGTAYVADIASSLVTTLAMMKAGMQGTVFQEFLGFNKRALKEFHKRAPHYDPDGRDGIRILPACHAPFSTSPAIFEAAGAWSREKSCPISVHLAESPDEVELLAGHGQEGELNAFLLERGIKDKEIPRPGARPVAYLDGLGVLGPDTLAVHLVETNNEELDLLKERGVTPCLCPSSNLHLLGRLPPVKAMLERGLAPCLGTDSPASGKSLNLFSEMDILLHEGVDGETVLAMGTLNGAQALKLSDDFGRLEEGTQPSVLHLPYDPNSKLPPLESALRNAAQGWAYWVLTPARSWVLLPQASGEEGERAP